MSDEKELVVITGASSGIGYELAKLFARDGWPLLLAARSGDKLTALAKELTAAHHVPVAVCVVDLAAPGGAASCMRRRSSKVGRSASSSTTPASATTAPSSSPTPPRSCRFCRSTLSL